MKCFLLACLLATPFVVVYAESEDPRLLLRRAACAVYDLSYKGVFIYQSVYNIKSVQITHINTGQGEYDRIPVLDGMPREMLSQGVDVVIFSSKNEKVIMEKRRAHNLFPAVLSDDMELLKASYQGRIGTAECIVWRDGCVVFLDPPDSLCYAYKFWADCEYGLLLKSLMLNDQRQMLEQMAFSQVNMMEEQGVNCFHPNVDHNKHYILEEAHAKPAQEALPSWTVGDCLQATERSADPQSRVRQELSCHASHFLRTASLPSPSSLNFCLKLFFLKSARHRKGQPISMPMSARDTRSWF